MQVLSNGEMIEAKIIGSYGIFQNPVVEMDGDEYVAEPVFVNSKLEILASVCQSDGCGHCEGQNNGCRYGIFKDYPVEYAI